MAAIASTVLLRQRDHARERHPARAELFDTLVDQAGTPS